MSVYKIVTEKELNVLKTTTKFDGTELDIRDGFIHMSKNMEQVTYVINKYYKNIDDIYLLHIDPINLENLKFEESKSGDIFPHLYCALNINNVIKIEKILLGI